MAGGVGGEVCTNFGIGGGHGNPSSGGAFDEALHDEEGFMDFFESGGVFADGETVLLRTCLLGVRGEPPPRSMK